MMDQAQRPHLPGLDGIRGCAILMVFLFHYGAGGASSPSHLTRLAGSVIRLGWAGVDLFFVLSGFLITGILLDSRLREDYYRTFYWRRALRIFPIFYLLAAILAIAWPHW